MKTRKPAQAAPSSTETPPMDAKPVPLPDSHLNCQIEIPPVDGLIDNQLTVGRDFFIHCKGEWPKDFVIEKAHFFWEKEQQKYFLKLLELQQRSGDEIDLKVTSYMAAKVQIPDLLLTDGAKTIGLGPINYEVASVLDPKQQKPVPYGPISAISIIWPLAYTLVVSAIGAFILGYIFRILWKKKQERVLKQKLRELETPLLPEAQFFKDYRSLKRESPIFYHDFTAGDILEARDRVDRMLRVFVSREFGVLATEHSSQRTLKDLRKNKRWVQLLTPELEADMARILVELERSKKDQERLDRADVLQYASWSQGLIEKLSSRIPEEKSR